MLDALSVPPKLVLRALEDLNTLAEGLRRLTERQGDIDDLLVAVNKLPEVEHDLARRVDELETQIGQLRGDIKPLHDTINALHAEIVDLRDKIPGI
jgi:predicted  nucleic acid-binding Zn-ribbon protein